LTVCFPARYTSRWMASAPRIARAPRLAPPARTQQQRRDATRGRILDAAVESLIASGVAGTTTLEVQTRAGVSRGALLHHFPSKAQLMAATITHLADMRGRELKAAAAALPRGKARTAAVFDLAWQSFTGPLFYVAMELRTAARTDAELRAALAATERAVHDRLIAQYRDLVGPAVADQPGFAAAFELTLQLMTGAAMTALLHGDRKVAPLIARWTQIFPTLLSPAPRRR
jgi:AcrR family transcriptional regulator